MANNILKTNIITNISIITKLTDVISKLHHFLFATRNDNLY